MAERICVSHSDTGMYTLITTYVPAHTSKDELSGCMCSIIYC